MSLMAKQLMSLTVKKYQVARFHGSRCGMADSFSEVI